MTSYYFCLTVTAQLVSVWLQWLWNIKSTSESMEVLVMAVNSIKLIDGQSPQFDCRQCMYTVLFDRGLSLYLSQFLVTAHLQGNYLL